MIRNVLNSDESIEDSSTPTIALFLGECCGVRLVWRGEKDDHVCFEILGEDDEYWFVRQGWSSSYWLPDLMQAITAANEWIKTHCDPDMYKGVQCGYRVHKNITSPEFEI